MPEIVVYLPGIWTGHTIIWSTATTFQWITTIDNTFSGYWKMTQTIIFLFDACIWHRCNPKQKWLHFDILLCIWSWLVIQIELTHTFNMIHLESDLIHKEKQFPFARGTWIWILVWGINGKWKLTLHSFFINQSNWMCVVHTHV